jgi:hypothetical protein
MKLVLWLAVGLASSHPAFIDAAMENGTASPPFGVLAAAVDKLRLAEIGQDRRVDPAWSRVRQLAPRTTIVVTVRGTRPAKRYFVAADETQLTIRRGGGIDERIAKDDVIEVSESVRHGRMSGTIGAAVGAALGLAVGLAHVSNSGKEEYGALLWSPLLGGLGGGFLGSRLFSTTEIIYQAP